MRGDDWLVDEPARDVEGAIAHFAERGYARLGRALSDEGLAALRARCEDLMLGRVVWPGMFFQHESASGKYEDLPYGKGYEGPSLDYRKLEKLEKDPLFFAWIQNPLFERVARAVIDGDVVIYRATLFNKPAWGGSPLPWHQDGGSFWGLDREPVLQIWTALDDAPLTGGCLEVVEGSHAAGLATPLGGVIPAEHVRGKDAEARAVPVPARAGEVLLIHNHLWHRSRPSQTGLPRRAFTICYMSAATRCLRKRRAPREFTRVF
ncbi:phytanoyl-CoA dioxygenase family protein [Chondromyces crocatus]|uniref:Phytanoyl-CoA dioxygenase n=1 Tax=Chondromyces crocatus TaxID=52 RepID=A0A0K1EST2_CHOCO|nr:phytanoyl-CoA dioxygenase family protein [Chondromyces crocatus]AKT43697.1 phytanoyl-CoA dioxygenase [Chondromyces crocatus]